VRLPQFASPAAIILSPTSGDVVLAAKAAEMPLIDFAFKTTLPISIIAIIAMASHISSGSATWTKKKIFLQKCWM
jgi:C4-dicarboxylate transporter